MPELTEDAGEGGAFRDSPPLQEPADCETLYMETRWLPGHLNASRVSIGATENNARGEYPVVSLQIVTFDKDWRCEVGGVWLVPDEVEKVVRGLQEARKRILAMRRAKTTPKTPARNRK